MSPSVTHKTSSPTSEVSIECSSGEGDVLAALEQAGFDEIREQDLSSEAAQSTDRISKRWLMLTFLTSPSAWVNRASQEFMEATISYDQGLWEGVFSYRFVSGARPK